MLTCPHLCKKKILLKFRVFWDVLPCSQFDVDRRFIGAYCLHRQGDCRSVDVELRTRQYIPEDSELHTRRRENLKSHIFICCLFCDSFSVARLYSYSIECYGDT
jgi:hypothetical protein